MKSLRRFNQIQTHPRQKRFIDQFRETNITKSTLNNQELRIGNPGIRCQNNLFLDTFFLSDFESTVTRHRHNVGFTV